MAQIASNGREGKLYLGPATFSKNKSKKLQAIDKKAQQYQGNSGVLDAPNSKVGKPNGAAANAYINQSKDWS